MDTKPVLNPLSESEQSRLFAEAEALRAECDRIMRLEPDADRHVVLHSLKLLKLSPEERLKRGLIRGRGYLAYPRANWAF